MKFPGLELEAGPDIIVKSEGKVGNTHDGEVEDYL